MQYFTIEANDHWGDYWQLIISGIWTGREDGNLKLQRTGPFVPSISVVGLENLIVTQAGAELLKDMKGVRQLRAVIKDKVVYCNLVDPELEIEDRLFADYREPIDILSKSAHDEKLSNAIGCMYEVVLESDGDIKVDFDSKGDTVATFLSNPSGRYDLFKAMTVGGFGIVVASQVCLSAIPQNILRWLRVRVVADAGSVG